MPSLTLFSLLGAKIFDERCYFGAGPSQGTQFGHAKAYNWLVGSRIVYRRCIAQ